MEKESAILELYEYVQMNKTSSKEYSMKLRKFIKAKEEFDKHLIDEQKEQLENLLEPCGDVHGQGRASGLRRVDDDARHGA